MNFVFKSKSKSIAPLAAKRKRESMKFKLSEQQIKEFKEAFTVFDRGYIKIK